MSADPRQRVTLGRVVGAHALRGEVRVRLEGDGANLASCGEVWLGEHEGDAAAEPYVVERVGSGRSGEARVALAGVTDRDAALLLRGRLVQADPDRLQPLEEGEFYWHQLIGCTVVSGEGEEIGLVEELWETGAHDVLVVRAASGKRHLLPTARPLLTSIDLEARRIEVQLLPGMLDQPI